MPAMMRQWSRPLLMGGAVALVMVAARGLAYGIYDHSELIPIVRHLADPRAYAGDYLFGAVEGYSTFFYSLLAALRLSEPGLTAVFLYGAIFLAALCLTLLVALCRRVEGTWQETWLASLAFALGYNPSLGHSFFDLSLTHALPGILLGLIALSLYQAGRPLPAFAVAGLLLNIHGMYAVSVLAILGVASAFEAPRPWARLLGGPILAAMFGFPALMAQMRPMERGVPLATWLEILRVRDNLHIFIGDVHLSDWVGVVTFLGILVRPWRPEGERATWSILVRSSAIVAGLGILSAVLFVEWHPLAVIVKLAPLRATFWLCIAGLPLWARSLREGLRQSASGLATALLLISLFLEPLSLRILALAFVASMLVARRLGPAWVRRASIGYVGAVLPMTLGRPVMGLIGVHCPAIWPLTGFHTYAVLATLAGGGMLWIVRKGAGEAAVGAAIALLAVVCCAQGLLSRQGSLLRTAPAPWLDVQRWARRSTAPEAVFVIPADLEGFRVGSWRSQYVDWRDGTLGNFNRRFARTWWERMVSLGLGFNFWADPGRAYAAYARVDSTMLCSLAARARLDYAITRDPAQMADLPLVYSNEAFYVRRITCAATDAPPVPPATAPGSPG